MNAATNGKSSSPVYAPVISHTNGYFAEAPFDSARQLVMTMLKFSSPMSVAARTAMRASLRTKTR
jgi:hypothetical protein